MHRKLKMFALAIALATACGGVAAQDFTIGFHPRTGDIWVDNYLGDMNRYGSRYREPFVDELVRYHGAPRDLVSELLGPRRWAPGDVYMACSIASIIGRPCRYVVDEWDRDHGQGWGVMAKRLGIKPGSAEFHRLKRGFVPTYDRWGRPIDIDVDLQRDFPGRGKGGKAGGNKGGGHDQVEHGNSGKTQSHGTTDHGSQGKGSDHGQGGQSKGKKGSGKGHGKG
jgi:hypothetical protein